ncbi:hypothetical protein, partial [Salmonella enterica]
MLDRMYRFLKTTSYTLCPQLDSVIRIASLTKLMTSEMLVKLL